MPAIFQRLMQTVLQGLSPAFCLVYIDDVVIFSKTFSEHINQLETIFKRLVKANLTLTPKCKFLMNEFDHLGHVVSKEGIRPNPKKVQVLQQMAPPTSVKALQRLLGLANWFWKFVPNFTEIVHPLLHLTRKDSPWNWSEDCQTAFQLLKDKLTHADIMAFHQSC